MNENGKDWLYKKITYLGLVYRPVVYNKNNLFKAFHLYEISLTILPHFSNQK